MQARMWPVLSILCAPHNSNRAVAVLLIFVASARGCARTSPLLHRRARRSSPSADLWPYCFRQQQHAHVLARHAGCVTCGDSAEVFAHRDVARLWLAGEWRRRGLDFS
eukprot:s4292_g3.t1